MTDDNEGRARNAAAERGPQSTGWVDQTRLRLASARRQQTEATLPGTQGSFLPKPRQMSQELRPEIPAEASLSVEALQRYRRVHATMLSGFEPQRHTMVVEGRPTQVFQQKGIVFFAESHSPGEEKTILYPRCLFFFVFENLRLITLTFTGPGYNAREGDATRADSVFGEQVVPDANCQFVWKICETS